MPIKSLSERDGKLRENWFIASLSGELTSSKPLARSIYDQPLVLFRDRNGKASCLPDRCLHRHARLSEGVIIQGNIACPYHGWVYDGSGKVCEIPSQGSQLPEGCANFKLRSLPTVEQDGCIWVWMGDGEPSTLTPPFHFPRRGQNGWINYFMITDFANEVTNLAENFMDVPHTIFVHRGWFRSESRKPVKIDVTTARGSVLVTYQQPKDQIGFTRFILNPWNHPMVHTDRFIMPNLTRVDYQFGANRGFVICSQCTPVSTLKSRVYTWIAYNIGALGWFLKPFMRFYTRQVITQDVEIMEIQQRNLSLSMDPDFHNSAADIGHQEIELLREFGRRGETEEYLRREFSAKTEIYI